jgi:hypothetical protein
LDFEGQETAEADIGHSPRRVTAKYLGSVFDEFWYLYSPINLAYYCVRSDVQ